MKDINLLPDDMKKSSKSNLKMEELKDKMDPKKILIGLSVVAAMLVLFFAPVLINMIMQQKLQAIKTEVTDPKFEPVKKERAAIKAEQTKIDQKKSVISDIDAKNPTIPEIFSAVNGIMPAGCYVSNMKYEKGALSIQGKVSEIIQIGEIITRAKRLKFLILDDNASLSYGEDKSFSFNFKIAGTGGGN